MLAICGLDARADEQGKGVTRMAGKTVAKAGKQEGPKRAAKKRERKPGELSRFQKVVIVLFIIVFALVEKKLSSGLGELGCATWTHPKGGYFVSFEGPKGSAKAIVSLAKDLGVTLTPAGAPWPYGADPRDTNIRIAPTYPSLDELGQALDVFVVAVKLVSARLARAERG